MADLEKVKTGLECCAIGAECDHCPYSQMNDGNGDFTGCHQLHWDALELLREQQPKKKEIWVIKKGNKYLHSYRAGRASWTTKGSGISIWNSHYKSKADYFASAVNGIVVNWDGENG